MTDKLAAVRTALRLRRRIRTLRRVSASTVATAGLGVAFTRFMCGALRDRRFTGEDEKEGRKRWVAVYDASVKVLRNLPSIKK